MLLECFGVQTRRHSGETIAFPPTSSVLMKNPNTVGAERCSEVDQENLTLPLWTQKEASTKKQSTDSVVQCRFSFSSLNN